MKKKVIAIIIIFPALFACASAPEPIISDYLCVEHGTHRPGYPEQLCACLNIDRSKYDEYAVFEINDQTASAELFPNVMDNARDEMERKIVNMIMRRIGKALEHEIKKYWQFDNFNIPVTIRSFKKKEGDIHHVKVVSAMRKYDLSPHGIIMYLPLEYKMHLFEKKRDK